MISTFLGIETALRALMAQRKAMETAGHNIANANTPGFSRQKVELASSRDPYTVPSLCRPELPGQLGTGVDIVGIERVRDQFLDLQVRNNSSKLGYWEVRRDSLQKVEVIFNEPGDNGLNNVLTAFWNAWQELSKTPESLAVRSEVRQRGITLAETIQHLYGQLQQLQEDLNFNVEVTVEQINTIAQQLADLNQQIIHSVAVGDSPNDLYDRRDLLLDRLAKMVDITISEQADGTVTVAVGGRNLVQGITVDRFQVVADPLNNNFYAVQWESDGTPVAFTSGSLAGMIWARDEGVANILSQVDELAATLISQVNAVHQSGYGLDGSTGNDFFSGTGAADMAVAAGILSDLNTIAAASDAAKLPGDGANALRLAQLRDAFTMPPSSPSGTFGDYYRSLVATTGINTEQAERLSENVGLLVSQLENRRQAVMGVSLDEEMANIVKFTHAYQAAARVLTTLDEQLDIIINRMGLVGR
ncbi:MAG: flagellar hook-associated protein FlgK [Bacillota bacterium]|jgi:flagellar hook-associated protein 1 FlgK|nr:flagellar hook-associated protein FlgK [Thermoanaerobacteraceae bacterium]